MLLTILTFIIFEDRLPSFPKNLVLSYLKKR